VSRRGGRRLLPLLLVIGGLGVAGALLERSGTFKPGRRALQRAYASASAFPGGRTIRFLSELGVLHPQPEDRAIPEDRRVLRAKRRARPDDASLGALFFFGVESTPRRRLPSSRLPDEVLSAPAPLLSVHLAPHDLAWLERHRLARGRAAERAAFVSYFEGGRLRFASGAGIRAHGGRSRTGSEHTSHRLYLRGEYGERALPARHLFGEQGAARRLVVHNDIRHDVHGRAWRFANPLAYDIARRIGALAPRTRPVRYYVNGESRGVFVLTEYLDEAYLESRFGHDRFLFLRTKSDPGAGGRDPDLEDEYEAFRAWARRVDPTMQAVAERVDLENLTRWLLSILFCGTTDAYQGPLLLDRTERGARWFWINWDMDHSFMSATGPGAVPAWEEDILAMVLEGPVRDPRAALLRRLLRHDAAYRAYFLELYEEVSTRLLTPEFLAERLDHYAALAGELGLEETGFLAPMAEFLARRPAALSAEIRRHLPVAGS
jgi:hypothetical protein